MSVVTNIDYEHIDIYPSLDNLKDTFVDFINSTPFYGMNIICYEKNTHINLYIFCSNIIM